MGRSRRGGGGVGICTLYSRFKLDALARNELSESFGETVGWGEWVGGGVVVLMVTARVMKGNAVWRPFLLKFHLRS